MQSEFDFINDIEKDTVFRACNRPDYLEVCPYMENDEFGTYCPKCLFFGKNLE